jgi:hypothetical protein
MDVWSYDEALAELFHVPTLMDVSLRNFNLDILHSEEEIVPVLRKFGSSELKQIWSTENV